MYLTFGLFVAEGCFEIVLATWLLSIPTKQLLNRWVAGTFLLAALMSFVDGILVVADGTFVDIAVPMVVFGLHVMELAVAVFVFLFVGTRHLGARIFLGINILKLVDMIPTLSGRWPIDGSHRGRWGNVFHLVPYNSWFIADDVLNVASATILLVILIHTIFTSAGRRRRMATHLLLLSLAGAAFRVACLIAWQALDLPDFSGLYGVVMVAYIFFTIRDYPYLMGVPPASAEWIESLPGLMLFTDGRGRILQASTRIAVLLGQTSEALRGQLLENLPLWSQIREAWPTSSKNKETRCRASIGDSWFWFQISPRFDRFHELESVLVEVTSAEPWAEAFERFGLSWREREVATMVAEGQSTAKLSLQLGITPGTVKTHLQNLFQKTGSKNRVELVRALRDPSSWAQSSTAPTTVK